MTCNSYNNCYEFKSIYSYELTHTQFTLHIFLFLKEHQIPIKFQI